MTVCTAVDIPRAIATSGLWNVLKKSAEEHPGWELALIIGQDATQMLTLTIADTFNLRQEAIAAMINIDRLGAFKKP
jgi:hypothetical protein